MANPKKPSNSGPDPQPRRPASGPPRRLHAFFSGSVQGVGFRYTTLSVSQNFEVTGWVRNLSDGRVELVAEGAEDEVSGFLSALEKAMAGYIGETERAWEPPTGEFQRFTIGYTF